jgi:hypothetical protein
MAENCLKPKSMEGVMKTRRVLMFTILFLCFLLATAAWASGRTRQSGFLEDYPKFTADKERMGAAIYEAPGVDLNAYTKLMIDPVEIWIAPDSKYKGIKPDEVKALADAFRAVLVEALEPAYPVVSKPGPGVLGIRMAITNVQLTKKKRGLLGYTPVGLVISAGIKNLGDNMSLQDANIEVELLDSETNERIGALIDQQSKTAEERKKSAKVATKLRSVQKGDTSWEAIESTLKYYAERFRGRMDMEHGR